jgi:Putative beta-barrel porin-2, OmpL-like. bbp2
VRLPATLFYVGFLFVFASAPALSQSTDSTPILKPLIPVLAKEPVAESKSGSSPKKASAPDMVKPKIATSSGDVKPATDTNSDTSSRTDLNSNSIPLSKPDPNSDNNSGKANVTTPNPVSNTNTASKSPPPEPSEPPRRALPSPLDPVFAMTEYPGGPLIGVPDTDPVFPMESIIYKALPILKKNRIKIYGWVDPSYNASTSKHSNVPLSYSIVPNRLELSQLVYRIERQPDTVQQEHMDWGFRYTGIFGIDYRYIAAAGWDPAATSLLKHNDLYGYDNVETYGLLYIPKVAQGMIVKVGRYISPPDIEAQLAPDNFLYTHSIMFTYDAYTHTGIQNTIKLSDQLMAQIGLHAGSDIAPWARAAHPTLEAFLRYTTKDNKNSVYGGIDALNGGSYKFQKDNLQQMNLTLSHKFNRRVNTMLEGYYLYTFDALTGGTVSNGPVKGFGGGGGPGRPLPGYSGAWGFTNYTNIKITDRDYITVRPIDYLLDHRGWRTGFPTTYASWTVGWCHRFSDLLCIRPEVRYERALTGHQNPYDNGTRRYQFTFSCDLIQRF